MSEKSWVTSYSTFSGIKVAVQLSADDVDQLVRSGGVLVKMPVANDGFAMPPRDRVVEVDIRVTAIDPDAELPGGD